MIKGLWVLALLIFLKILNDQTPIASWLQEQEKAKTLTREIEILGPVRYPGVYFTKVTEMELTSLIKISGGLQPGYKLFPGETMTYLLTNDHTSIDIASHIFYSKRNHYVRRTRK